MIATRATIATVRIDALEQFSDEIEALTEKAKSLGMFQAFAEVVTPVDAERADFMESVASAG